MKNNKFAGAIWTDHAMDRMKERGIPKDYATEAIKNPDSFQSNNGDGTKSTKKIADRTITLVTKKNERGEKIVVSIWMDPPMIGTKDHKNKLRYKKYKKASVGGKIWMTILKQLGL